MKGVVLAGGTGTRLWPLTWVTNKHLLPVGRMPMIHHPVLKLREAGIREILVVTGREHMGDVVGLLGSGAELGLAFSFRVQDEAGGIAQALALAEGFSGGDPLVAILGDNVFEDSLAPYVNAFARNPGGARVLLKRVPDAQRFGVATLDTDGERVVRIAEKPSSPESDLAVTGVYLYDGQVFDIIRDQTPSSRGELEITDVNNAYIARGQLGFGEFAGWWSDAGTPASYARANHLAAAIEPPPELRR
ncbi:MAG: sugar phosphate nucleotidyltransferase [Myxococcota bacterium]|jgi:glucose-1-phosphate thymidylyltransferase|nr:sugar phosphate nucleotidyltransferase [Myxococcota bacterium]